MDGKYAKYIENFMKEFKLTGEKGESIEIQTSENPKNKPLVYSTSREKIAECNEKLDKQYDIVINNKEEIKKDHFKKTGLSVLINGIVLIGAVLFSKYMISLSSIASLISFIIACLACTGITSTIISGIIWNHKFKKEIEMAEFYKANRSQIELVMNNDKNITSALSQKSEEILRQKKALVSKSKAEEILDIDFMDKLLDRKYSGRKDLMNLLKMYKAVICMNQEPVYSSPVKEEVNKRVRTPKESKKSTKK